MQYREIKPSASLAPYVECFWVLEDHGLQTQETPERLLPDGCIELILNFGSLFREHPETDLITTQPARFLVGQMTRPILISATGPVELLGIRFHPAGAAAFFSIPMTELTNRVVPLAEVSGPLERDVLTRVCGAGSLAQKMQLTEALLVRHLNRYSPNVSLRPAVSRIMKTGGQISIDALANDLGISGRQLQRRFLFEVGIGPKLLCRILRFQQVFRAIDRGDDTWAAVATDCGYYDQAHLIKEFQQFTGHPPGVIFERFTPFTEQFTRKHRMSDFYNTKVKGLG